MNDKVYRIHLPNFREFFVLILTYLFVYLKFPFLTLGLVTVTSYVIFLNKNTEKALLYFFILSFTLPHGFILRTLGFNIGNYINEYFVAGIPLYFAFLNYFRDLSLKHITKEQKFVFVCFIILFVNSTFLPGLFKLIGIGGYRVRLVQVFNYLNAFLLFFLFTKIRLSIDFIRRLKNMFIYLGVFLSFLGILQYLFKISLVPLYTDEYFSYSRLFLLNSVNSNACIPFLLVPLSFIMVTIFYNRTYSFRNFFILLILLVAIYLTHTRIAYIATLAMSLYVINKLYRSRIINYAIILVFSCFIYVIGSVIYTGNVEMRSTGSSMTRFYLWGLGLTAIYESPLRGYGLGNQAEAMFQNESEFNFLDGNKFNSVDTFSKQSVHQYFLDGMLSFGVLYAVPFFLMFINFFRKLNIVINRRDLKSSFYFSIKLSIVGLLVFSLINVMQQHYFFLGLYGLMNKENLNLAN